MTVESVSQDIDGELKIKFLVKFFCVSLDNEEIAEGDKPRHISSRFVTT